MAFLFGHHSLVTPIDWKAPELGFEGFKLAHKSPLVGDTYWLETL